jgi:hypothetical protein
MHGLEYNLKKLFDDVRDDKLNKAQLLKRIDETLGASGLYVPAWDHPTDNGTDYPEIHREKIKNLKSQLAVLIPGF